MVNFQVVAIVKFLQIVLEEHCDSRWPTHLNKSPTRSKWHIGKIQHLIEEERILLRTRQYQSPDQVA